MDTFQGNVIPLTNIGLDHFCSMAVKRCRFFAIENFMKLPLSF
jgi:hypothetical protein